MNHLLRRIALGLIMAVLPLLPVLAGKTWVWQGALVSLIVALALVLWCAGVLREREQTAGGWRPDAIDWALAAFVLLQLLSWFPSVYRFASAVYGAKVVAYAAAFWLLRYGLRDGRWWRAALWCTVLGGLLLAVIGLQEYVRTVKFLNDAGWRVFGPMFNPNIAAGYLLLTFFPALALLFGAQSRRAEAAAPAPLKPRPPLGREKQNVRADKKRVAASRPAEDEAPQAPRYTEIAGFFSALLMFVTTLLTGSKAGLGALLVGSMGFAWVAFRGTKARLLRWGVLAFVLGTVVLAFALPPLRVRLLSAFGGQSHSSIFRAYTWQATLDMIGARPLQGFGGGTFESILPKYAVAGFTRAAHQSYLQIAAECGVPALLAGLVWGLLLLVALYRLAIGGKEPLQRLVAVGAMAGLAASGLQQMVDYAWYVPAVGLTFFALAGLALAPDEGGVTRPAGGLPRTALAWAGLVAGLCLLVWSVRVEYAEGLGMRAEAQIAAGDYALAATTLERAQRVNPAQAQLWVKRAKVLEAMSRGSDQEMLAASAAARRAAIKLQPSEPLNYLALARLQEQQGDLATALQTAEQALTWYPTYPRGLAQVARLQERTGRHEAALATFRKLVAVYHSPVGQYPPVTELIETAYAHAWIALGDKERREGREQGALREYRQAAELLDRALTSERGLSAQMAAAGEGSWGHVEENTVIAGDVLQRLQKSESPVSVKLMVELHRALGDDAEATRLLGYIADAPPVSSVGRRVQAWAVLALAQALEKEQGEEARALAKKGLSLARSAGTAGAIGEEWQPRDAEDLNRLKGWGETLSR